MYITEMDIGGRSMIPEVTLDEMRKHCYQAKEMSPPPYGQLRAILGFCGSGEFDTDVEQLPLDEREINGNLTY